MSILSLLGGVAGGVIGFAIGGPAGAYTGAALGMGVGAYADTMMADVPSAGAPEAEEAVMQSSVGDPIKDLCGTALVVGHLLFFGGERSEKVYSDSGSYKGDEPDPQVVGFDYYMSWGVGLIRGPADKLWAIYKNDDAAPVWYSEDGLDLPASGGQETITLPDVGGIEFYFGTTDQVVNSKVADLLPDPTLNVPYRRLCWAFFDDCYIGRQNRTPTYKFVLSKFPNEASIGNATIRGFNSNPMQVIWYILNTLAGLPSTWLDATSMSADATTLFNEGRGVSVLFGKQATALTYTESVLNHADGLLRYDVDGSFHSKLIRDDYNVATLPSINGDVILEEPTFSRKSWIGTANEVKVQFTEIINVPKCDVAGPIVIDESSSVSTLAPSSSGIIYWTGSYISFRKTVEITSGTGFYLDAARTATSVTITGNSVTVYTDATACGTCVVTITDECLESTSYSFAGTGGSWIYTPITDASRFSNLVTVNTITYTRYYHWTLYVQWRYETSTEMFYQSWRYTIYNTSQPQYATQGLSCANAYFTDIGHDILLRPDTDLVGPEFPYGNIGKCGADSRYNWGYLGSTYRRVETWIWGDAWYYVWGC